MENFYLHAVVDDARPRLVGASVGRVWQPSDRLVALDLRLEDGRLLVISADPADPGLYLSSQSHRELEAAGGERQFAALVRKRLRGATLDVLAKPARDRIVRLAFSHFAPSGERTTSELVAALTGRSANVYLLDDAGTLLGAIRPLPSDGPLVMGWKYATTPIDERPALESLDDAEVDRLAREGEPSRLLAGIGPTLRRELEARAVEEGLAAALRSLRSDLTAPPRSARLYEDDSGTRARFTLATFPLVSERGATETRFDDPSRAADARAKRLESARRIEAQRRSITSRAEAAVAKIERLLAALDADEAGAAAGDRDREVADSLLAQVATARFDGEALVVADLYDPEGREIRVPADRGETPQAVAERLFERQRKAKRTREEVATRRAAAEARLSEMREIADAARTARGVEALAAVEERLDRKLGVRRISKENRPAAKRDKAVSGVRRFVSSDGFEILVGRSSRSNDELTFKIARSGDLWLHAADYPGSHVVVRNPSRLELPHRTILEAASLAAYYSEAGQDATVDVRYTPRKFVSKPKGGAPGLVRLGPFKTIAVTPRSDLA
jgi:predicted ribosome quality control (RQC) complex YloA/Tae2 family protein